MTAPKNGDIIVEGKKFTVGAEATDDFAVSHVEFLVDGEVRSRDTTRPYRGELTVPYESGLSSIVVGASAVDYGGNVGAAADIILAVQLDTDQDGLGDDQETTTYHTDPLKPDTDGDGLKDGDEVDWGTDPLKKDESYSRIVYQTDFEAGIDSAWNNNSLSSDNILGKYHGTCCGNGATTLTLYDLPPHNNVVLKFDLYLFSTWDGESPYYGKDYFNLSGDIQRSWTFTNHQPQKQSYPGTPDDYVQRQGT